MVVFEGCFDRTIDFDESNVANSPLDDNTEVVGTQAAVGCIHTVLATTEVQFEA